MSSVDQKTVSAVKNDDVSRLATSFLEAHEEKLKMNQYWYSEPTLQAMVKGIQESGATRVAFLSTPSVYFSLTDETLKANSSLFDYDEMWASEPGFVKYDYRKPEDIPAKYLHSFDLVVIDPPFVTDIVWEKYIEATLLLWTQGASYSGPEGKTNSSSTIDNTKEEKKEEQALPDVAAPEVGQLEPSLNYP